MNDMVDLPGLPPGVAEALADGTLRDPFGVLGPHDTGMGRIVRAFLPGALEVEVLARAGGDSLGPARARRAARAVRRHGGQRRALSAAHHLAGRRAGDRGPVFVRPAARRTRSASVQRGAAFRTGIASRRRRGDDRRRARRALCRLGAERARRVGGRRLQRLGHATPADAAAFSGRRVGDLRPAPRQRARATNTPSWDRMAHTCR